MSTSIDPIPGYRILDNLGEGGFARVYLAEQTALERNVALKVMSPKLADDVDYCERFLREGRTLAKLSHHPDIVTIFDIGKAGRYYFMAMEYLGGPDLKGQINATGFSGNTDEVITTIARRKSGVCRRYSPATASGKPRPIDGRLEVPPEFCSHPVTLDQATYH